MLNETELCSRMLEGCGTSHVYIEAALAVIVLLIVYWSNKK